MPVTQLSPIAIPGGRYSFVAKTAALVLAAGMMGTDGKVVVVATLAGRSVVLAASLAQDGQSVTVPAIASRGTTGARH